MTLGEESLELAGLGRRYGDEMDIGTLVTNTLWVNIERMSHLSLVFPIVEVIYSLE